MLQHLLSSIQFFHPHYKLCAFTLARTHPSPMVPLWFTIYIRVVSSPRGLGRALHHHNKCIPSCSWPFPNTDIYRLCQTVLTARDHKPISGIVAQWHVGFRLLKSSAQPAIVISIIPSCIDNELSACFTGLLPLRNWKPAVNALTQIGSGIHKSYACSHKKTTLLYTTHICS